jgi:TonB family protein
MMDLGESPVVPPGLLIDLPPWHSVFRRNLLDLLSPKQLPPLRLASKPADFWPDVFVPSHLPWRRFFESTFYHGLVVLLLLASSWLWASRPRIAMDPALRHEDVIYYQASELLPPLNTGAAHPKRFVKGDPAYAPQPIISVPREASNQRQTIVAPPALKLDHDVPLPNVVSWPKAPLAVPIAATERTVLAKTQSLDAPVVEPPPDVKMASSRHAIRGLQPAVVQPSPTVEAASARRVGDLNIAQAQVVAPAPQLPVEAQRARTSQARLGSASVVPPPPSVSGTGIARAGGRLIALSIHPAVASALMDAPSGNRRGSFAATPQGKAGAAGTPDIAGAGQNSEKGSEAGVGNGARSDAPAGLYVGAGNNNDAKRSVVGGNGQGSGSGTNSQSGSSQSSSPQSQSKDAVLMASANPPRVSGAPHRQAEDISSAPETEAEKEVFGDRKFYSMTQSVPNLNSAAGSWVIHFAEMNHDEDKNDEGKNKKDENKNEAKGELVAPTAIAMSDPAYPLELMKQHVQGTVTLYAVIGSDGSVSGVRVLNGIDDHLDEYARQAFARWQFRPASKNGTPVALEAVVKIPFHPARARAAF